MAFEGVSTCLRLGSRPLWQDAISFNALIACLPWRLAISLLGASSKGPVAFNAALSSLESWRPKEISGNFHLKQTKRKKQKKSGKTR